MTWKGLTKIVKDTEVFLPKKFEDNKVVLPNVSKAVAIGKIKLR